MKRLTQGILILLMLSLVVSTAIAGAKENAAAKAGKTTSEGQAVQKLSLASDLAAYGRTEKNPAALLVAAQIMKNVTTKEAAQKKETTAAADAKVGAGPGSVITADALLVEAKDLAGDNLQMASMIDAEMKRTVSTRGDVTGPNRHADRIYPGKTDSYTITFRGEEEAEVAVLGDGDNDLDLYVYDEFDNLIAKDIDRTDACIVTWTPSWTGKFKIKIKNLGTQVYSDYVLLTN